MPVYYEKKPCKQADGDKGTYTLYEKKPGKNKKIGCATSKKKAKAYVSGSYAKWDWSKTKKTNESLEENILKRLLEISMSDGLGLDDSNQPEQNNLNNNENEVDESKELEFTHTFPAFKTFINFLGDDVVEFVENNKINPNDLKGLVPNQENIKSDMDNNLQTEAIIDAFKNISGIQTISDTWDLIVNLKKVWNFIIKSRVQITNDTETMWQKFLNEVLSNEELMAAEKYYETKSNINNQDFSNETFKNKCMLLVKAYFYQIMTYEEYIYNLFVEKLVNNSGQAMDEEKKKLIFSFSKIVKILISLLIQTIAYTQIFTYSPIILIFLGLSGGKNIIASLINIANFLKSNNGFNISNEINNLSKFEQEKINVLKMNAIDLKKQAFFNTIEMFKKLKGVLDSITLIFYNKAQFSLETFTKLCAQLRNIFNQDSLILTTEDNTELIYELISTENIDLSNDINQPPNIKNTTSTVS